MQRVILLAVRRNLKYVFDCGEAATPAGLHQKSSPRRSSTRSGGRGEAVADPTKNTHKLYRPRRSRAQRREAAWAAKRPNAVGHLRYAFSLSPSLLLTPPSAYRSSIPPAQRVALRVTNRPRRSRDHSSTRSEGRRVSYMQLKIATGTLLFLHT